MIPKNTQRFRAPSRARMEPLGLWAIEPETIEVWCRLTRRDRLVPPLRPRVNHRSWADSRFRGNRGAT